MKSAIPSNQSVLTQPAASSKCWICGCTDATEVKKSDLATGVTSEDFKITDAQYGRTARILRCPKCSFYFAHPLPSEDLVEMYAGLVDHDYYRDRDVRIEPLRRIVKQCLILRPEAKTLLDIGASTGLLCRAATELGLNAIGVEPSHWAVETARQEEKTELIEGIFPNAALAGRTFDLITLVDVIEHVSDPVGLLRDIRAALNPNGLVAIVTPNVNSLVARMLGRKWWHFRVAHVGYFSPQSMNEAFKQAGLITVRSTSYSWYFKVGYLAERVEKYLPTKWLRKLITRAAVGRRLMDCCVPLNLHDSRVYYATTD